MMDARKMMPSVFGSSRRSDVLYLCDSSDGDLEAKPIRQTSPCNEWLKQNSLSRVMLLRFGSTAASLPRRESGFFLAAPARARSSPPCSPLEHDSLPLPLPTTPFGNPSNNRSPNVSPTATNRVSTREASLCPSPTPNHCK
jgi:hypothetical protein